MTASKRVLLVEDDADIAEIVALHLRDEGYAVVHATDGPAGLKLLEQHAWDALVLDLMLPGIDGLEICRRARSMERYTPIIITSARGSETHRVLGLEIGADDYLAKPFSVLELVARVRALLRRIEAVSRASTTAGVVRVGDIVISALEREAKLAGNLV
ncbi:MAG TPA: response regulator transcription factor, partial [Gammaproteobacteria bacterium]|nr:response regulator transcription factor [Gammaproteobacteria bacterium]